MSGITGIFYLDGQLVDRSDLSKMTDILAHRGPDGSAVWSEGSIGLGHRMLWTTPESLIEKLPLVNHTSDLAITADARIDNRDELIAALNLTNYPIEKITDSQLILSAYERWGISCPEHLLGDFAFAISDRRKQVIFCARDHFGIKPFYYYYCSDRAFVFASEIKALLCLPEIPHQLNEKRIADYLALMFDDSTDTSYENILRLPPAHSLIVSYEGKQLRSYWSLDPSREVKLGSDEEYAEAFRAIFTEAVRCRLRSAFTVGSMLSGGLDSSAVTAVAKNLLAQSGKTPLPTFSITFDEVAQCDERPFINAVLAQGGLASHYVQGDKLSPLAELDRVLWYQEEVSNAPSLCMQWGLCKAAHQQGVRVLLDGFDGDTTVSHGFGYLDELAYAGRWLSLASETRGLARTFNTPFWETFWPYLQSYGLTSITAKFPALKLIKSTLQALLRQVQLLRRYRSADQPTKGKIINPDFVQRMGLRERFQSWKQTQPGLAQTEREEHYRSIISVIQPFALEVLDKAAAAFFIEPRYPFWDKRLVEFCLALPPEQKLRRGWSRLVMRNAMDGILPKKVQWRRDKSNFFPVFCHWLRTFERERLDEVVLNNSGVVKEYVNTDTLQQIYHRFTSLESPVLPKDVQSMWRVAVLTLWLKFIESNNEKARR